MKRIATAAMALVDQVAINCANFSASVFLIACASKDEYGLYGAAYSALLLATSSFDVMFSLQMTYLVPHKPESKRNRFFLAVRSALLISSLAVSALGSSLGIVLWVAGKVAPAECTLFIVVSLGIPLISLQEYYRSVCYLKKALREALLITFIAIVSWSCFVALAWTSQVLSLSVAVLAGSCFGAACSSIYACHRFRLPDKSSWSDVVDCVSEVWEQGGWSLLGSVVSWVQNQSYAWVLLTFAGASATAEANFSKLFFSPLSLFLVAANRIFRPDLASIYANSGAHGTIEAGRRVLIIIIAILCIYGPGIWIFHPKIIELTHAQAYQGVSALVLAWCLVSFFQVTRWNSTLLLGVLRRNKEMTTLQAGAAVMSFAISIVVVPAYGATGAIVAIATGEAVLTLLMWIRINRIAA